MLPKPVENILINKLLKLIASLKGRNFVFGDDNLISYGEEMGILDFLRIHQN